MGLLCTKFNIFIIYYFFTIKIVKIYYLNYYDTSKYSIYIISKATIYVFNYKFVIKLYITSTIICF